MGLLRLRLDSDKFFSGFSNANAASCLLAANGELFSNEENLFSAEELQAVLTDSPGYALQINLSGRIGKGRKKLPGTLQLVGAAERVGSCL